jgi:uncharacterized protein YlxW (UPF0749 family)
MTGGREDAVLGRTVGTMAAPRPWAPQGLWGRAARVPLLVWMMVAVLGWGTAAALATVALRDQERTARLAALAGLTPVTGPGIEVVLTDSTQALSPGENPSVALVQDGDLIFLNMMLWYGGARAVAINGQRVTAQTTITSSGPTILINGHRLVGPFHVVAVGDPRVLRGVLETRGGFVERMRQSGIGVRIVERQELAVPPWNPDATGAR